MAPITKCAPVADDQSTDPPVKVFREPPATLTSSVVGKPSAPGPPRASYLPRMAPQTKCAPVAFDQNTEPRVNVLREPPATPTSSVVGKRSAPGLPGASYLPIMAPQTKCAPVAFDQNTEPRVNVLREPPATPTSSVVGKRSAPGLPGASYLPIMAPQTKCAPVAFDQNTEPRVNVLREPPATPTSSVVGKRSAPGPPRASYLPRMAPQTKCAPVAFDQNTEPRVNVLREPPATPTSSVVGKRSAPGLPGASYLPIMAPQTKCAPVAFDQNTEPRVNVLREPPATPTSSVVGKRSAPGLPGASYLPIMAPQTKCAPVAFDQNTEPRVNVLREPPATPTSSVVGKRSAPGLPGASYLPIMAPQTKCAPVAFDQNTEPRVNVLREPPATPTSSVVGKRSAPGLPGASYLPIMAPQMKCAPVAFDQNTEPRVNVLREPPATPTSSVVGKPSAPGPPRASYLPRMAPQTKWAPVAFDQNTEPRVNVLREPPATPTSSVVGNPNPPGPPSAMYFARM